MCMKITAVIITHNEEKNIVRCLESLQSVVDEVVVVDSGSADKTEELCRKYAVRFEKHPWEGYSRGSFRERILFKVRKNV